MDHTLETILLLVRHHLLEARYYVEAASQIMDTQMLADEINRPLRGVEDDLSSVRGQNIVTVDFRKGR